LRKEVFQAQGGALGCLVEEKLEEYLVRLKLRLRRSWMNPW
jgi:hypothetical protein